MENENVSEHTTSFPTRRRRGKRLFYTRQRRYPNARVVALTAGLPQPCYYTIISRIIKHVGFPSVANTHTSVGQSSHGPRTHALLFFSYGRRTMAGTSCSVFNVLLYLNDCTSVFFLSNAAIIVLLLPFSLPHTACYTTVVGERIVFVGKSWILRWGVGDNSSRYGHASIIPDGFVITPPTIDLRTWYVPARRTWPAAVRITTLVE